MITRVWVAQEKFRIVRTVASHLLLKVMQHHHRQCWPKHWTNDVWPPEIIILSGHLLSALEMRNGLFNLLIKTLLFFFLLRFICENVPAVFIQKSTKALSLSNV